MDVIISERAQSGYYGSCSIPITSQSLLFSDDSLNPEEYPMSLVELFTDSPRSGRKNHFREFPIEFTIIPLDFASSLCGTPGGPEWILNERKTN
jgi:hypothetical protein